MDTTDITIRQAAAQDSEPLAELHVAAWRAAYRGIMSDDYLDGMDVARVADGWRRNLGTPNPGTTYLVAAVAGRPVGFAAFGPAPGEDDAGTGELRAINVHPGWWGRGAGSALFTEAERRLAGLGCARAFLWVARENRRAHLFYERHGWTNDGGVLEDTRFSPPVFEVRYSRDFPAAAPSERQQKAPQPRGLRGFRKSGTTR
ncbi:GNAT family N-acetyltransferase [Arthrobacter sp. 7Tela_A1]|uniref:GNAT family N-acetyltransferase n=1 Tax=Arthrobacter sp. 7Tela_A1 TaxID=3093745 RepID=UPI003BB48F27